MSRPPLAVALTGDRARPMSGLPSGRRNADAAPAKDDAWSTVRSAQEAWAGAMRTHEMAPPDAGFRDRLRNLAEAASAMRDTHAQALEAGLAWRPIEGSDHARPPYELRPGTGRRGPHELWARFDEAVAQLNAAGAGDNLADVVASYAAVSEAACALADALQAGGDLGKAFKPGEQPEGAATRRRCAHAERRLPLRGTAPLRSAS